MSLLVSWRRVDARDGRRYIAGKIGETSLPGRKMSQRFENSLWFKAARRNFRPKRATFIMSYRDIIEQGGHIAARWGLRYAPALAA
jgi:hypothetical protein